MGAASHRGAGSARRGAGGAGGTRAQCTVGGLKSSKKNPGPTPRILAISTRYGPPIRLIPASHSIICISGTVNKAANCSTLRSRSIRRLRILEPIRLSIEFERFNSEAPQMPPSPMCAPLRLALHYETSRNPRRESNPQDEGRPTSKRRWRRSAPSQGRPPASHGAICLACAVVVALGESGALHPNHVMRWAAWMAENQPPATEPAVSEVAARMLRNFAKITASMMEASEGFASRN